MDETTKQALNNAKSIIKTVIEIAESISEICALLNLDGLTVKQKIGIETAVNLLNHSRGELLKATYPNDDLFGINN